MTEAAPRHQLWIDRGGTFTDCIYRDRRTGALRVTKVLSSDLAPIEGIRTLLDLGVDDPIPPIEVRMGTTLATNALLERGGHPTVLVANRGLGDLGQIGDQTRPDLFALAISRPEPLPELVVEIEGRHGARGELIEELRDSAVRQALEEVREQGTQSIAISLIHAYADGSMEHAVARIAEELGFEHVSMSHEVSNELGLLGRTDTTVANAYLTPLLTHYMQTLERELGDGRLRMMQSNGGLVDARGFIGATPCSPVRPPASLPRVMWQTTSGSPK